MARRAASKCDREAGRAERKCSRPDFEHRWFETRPLPDGTIVIARLHRKAISPSSYEGGGQNEENECSADHVFDAVSCPDGSSPEHYGSKQRRSEGRLRV